MSDSNQSESSEHQKIVDSIKTLTRGEDVDDLQQKCLSICQQYLGGFWSQFTIEDIEVKRLTGGLSNKVYHCRPIASVEDNHKDVTQDVVLRFYGQKFDLSLGYNPVEGRLDEVIVGLLASENRLGPTVYGVFEDGQLMKYYPHRLFKENDLNDPDLCKQLATKLARFHSMDVPVSKEIKTLETILNNSVRRLTELKDKFTDLYKKWDCNTLLEFDMKSEVNWVLKQIPSLESPKVFSHHDFRFENQLVSEDNEVILNDFELSAYGYRGFDFGSCFKHMDQDHPNIRQFITYYVKECEEIFGESYSRNPNNSVDHIVKECKQFSIVLALFMASLLLHNDIWQMPFNEKTYMTFADKFIEKYLANKHLLIE